MDIKSSVSILGWTFEFTHIDVSDLGFELLFSKADLSSNRWKLATIGKFNFEPENIKPTWRDSTLPTNLIPSSKHFVQNHLNFLWIPMMVGNIEHKLI